MKLEIGKSYHTRGSEDFPSFVVRIVGYDDENNTFFAMDDSDGMPFTYQPNGVINNYEWFVALGGKHVADAGELVMEVSNENA